MQDAGDVPSPAGSGGLLPVCKKRLSLFSPVLSLGSFFERLTYDQLPTEKIGSQCVLNPFLQ